MDEIKHYKIYSSARRSQYWQQLQSLAKQPWSLAALFAQDDERATRFSRQAGALYMDYSKQCIDETVLANLLSLATSCDLPARIKALLQGAMVNTSEARAALHTALRLPETATLQLDGQDVVADVHQSLSQVARLSERVRSGTWRGFSGKAITDVVNIGVGGSDLGPLMATAALDEWADTEIEVHFVSNMDGTQLDNLLKHLNPETTLFIISSKSFGTIDTLSNAKTALSWLLATAKLRAGTEDSVLRRHFIGISANSEKMSAWGIHPEHQLQLWEWVGGRFSLWSAIGLAIAIRIGMAGFKALLAGAHSMDEHFAQADFTENLPVLLGLLAVWNSTFLQVNAHTVLPYDGRLSYLPSYLTQLEMESNGKSVTQHGDHIDYDTCPILWGEIGSNAQHAFYQLLHQGTQQVSCDFIACVRRYSGQSQNAPLQQQHELSLANCLAQSRVLAFGNAALQESEVQVASAAEKYKYYRGNQPSTTLLIDELTPHSLGALVALYEHKVYVMASIWDINPFDQWGVEMGKQMAESVHQAMQQETEGQFDTSTDQLLQHIRQLS
ncbi:glucose-6-phosphate isomerase [Psychrobacter sp. Sarcosine-3u-12]|uniref:glucose-6-phosphate isomerase n=1 Tax=Psychrobacter sp. Sarcosine-3u-12 TaxID=2058325 RepID=UPI000C3451FF|nr:glucose-6-phosphate isomerase [Psychrobacter sp. Sarcosine-3u-12]PKG34588.1 glucose-6-phosphate isomerase [Psychrobacter sp. Sarcosine-3u-12]